MLLLSDSFTPSSQQWALIGLLAFIGGALYLARRRTRPLDGTPTQYRREIDSANRDTQQLRDDLERLLTELETLSARQNAQLQERHDQLQSVITDADQRIFALRALLHASKPAAIVETVIPKQSAPIEDATESRKARIFELADQGHTTLEIAQRVGGRVGEVELILNLRRVRAAQQSE